MPQYQGIWTLPQQSQALTNQQWVTDPYYKNTTLHLQADGTGSGSQNQTFLDSSSNNFYISRFGNTTQGSFSPFCKPDGQWSNYFDGSGDYISMPSATSVLALSSGDWTVECFAYVTSLADNRTLIDIYDGNSSVRFIWRIKTSGLLAFQGADGTDRSVTTTAVPTNTWVHLAICKSSGTTRMFINGVQANTNYTDSNTYANGGASAIGIISSDLSSSPFLGYISNFRVVKGTALYSANFNPPTLSLSAITNTSLLTCQSNRFIDNSSSPLTLTIGGTPYVQAFSPFAPARQWTSDVVGGSGYFDGSSDYISLTDTNNLLDLGGAVASLECWFYPTATGTSVIMGKGGGSADWSNSSGFEWQIQWISGVFKFIYNSGNTNSNLVDPTTRVANQWYHVAVATDTSNNISLYVNGTRVVTGTNAITKPTTRTLVNIGQDVSSNWYSGYASGLRFIKGSGAYDASSSTITVPTTPVTAITNTQLLLNYANAGIYDGTMNNNLETVGNAQVVTIPAKNGSGSMYFPPTNGNYCIGPPNQPHLLFGTGDFTIEAWVYPTAFTNTATGIFGYGLSGGYVDWNLELDTSGNALYIDNDGGRFYSNSNLARNTWTHVCIVRDRSQGVRLYFNGTNVNATAFRTINNISGSSTSARLYVGTGAQVPGSRQFIGYIDDLRITKGVARYLTNFTPPQQALPRQ